MLRGLSVTGVALGLSCLSVGAAQAAARPNPPQQLCIGSNCVNTPSGVGARVKWHPGHYGASAGLALFGDSISKFTPEMDDMLKDDWIVGYRLGITWSALDAGPVKFTGSVGNATSGKLATPVSSGSYWVAFSNGQYRQVTVTNTTDAAWTAALSAGTVTGAHLYTTDLVDQALNRVKTHYKKPKQLVIDLTPMSFYGGTRASSDYSRVPKYITTDPANGPSPDGKTFGWWGPPPGVTAGAYTAALYRPGVAAHYAALGTALGAKYESDPNFEAIMDQETSAVVGPAVHFPPTDNSYSDAAYVTQLEMYLQAWLAAFPTTNIIVQNTWLGTSTPTQQFEAWMMANRIAPSTADASGQSYYDLGHLPNWGLQTYMGLTVSYSSFTGADMRGKVRPMIDVEQPDIGTSVGSYLGDTPLDIINGLNKTIKASHAFWSHVAGGRGPSTPPTWAQMTVVFRDNPLTNTGYPSNYP